MENKIIVNAEKGTNLIEVREGSSLKLREPSIVNLTGTITSVSSYLAKREISSKESHVIIDDDNQEIILCVNEHDYYKDTIKGKLLFDSDLNKFGINEDKLFSIGELIQLLRLKKYMFADSEQHLKLISSLKQFKIKIEKDIENSDDDRGNTRKLIEQKLTTEVPMNFTLDTPIFKGEPKSKFEVEIAIILRDAAIALWLQSSELETLTKSISEKKLDLEEKKIIATNKELLILHI